MQQGDGPVVILKESDRIVSLGSAYPKEVTIAEFERGNGLSG
jgi:hypothetical protein